jgi:pimeloyl-ACP methyl ester carboxylesterase
MTTKAFDKIYRNAPREQTEQLLRFRETHPHKRLTIAGLDWDYVAGGSGPETLLVCVGGARSSDPAFQLISALEKEYRVIAPTYPYADRMDQLIEGIKAILEAEGVKQIHIWGTSLGGMVVQCFVRKYPQRVKTMIAGDTFIPSKALAEKDRQQSRWLRFVPLQPLIPWVRNRMNGVITSEIPDEGERAFWRAFIDEWLTTEYNREWILKSREISADYGANYSFQPEDLADWAGRILIIDSDTDRTVGAENLKQLKAMYPRAQTYTFTNAGHVPVITRRDEYISLVRGFLKQQKK